MSNALEAASLIMVPSGYENGTLGSLKPTDGTGDFTFSRGSDISATRVNEQGYIEKGYENLLLQSNTFSNAAWTTSGQMLTPVGGQSGYDGTTDAWKIQRSDATAQNIKQNISQSGVQTFSVYAKAGNVDYISVISVGGAVTKAIFSLPSDGSGVNTLLDSDNIAASIEYISEGWYRVSTAFDEPITDIRIYPSETGTIEGGVITDAFIYIQDAMLNQGLVAYPYVETTTAPVAGGILEDMPRLDYSNGSCPALLLEPSRTNKITYSEYFGAGWSLGTNVTLDQNYSVSPEGYRNASRLNLTASVVKGIERVVSGAFESQTHTISVWARCASGTESFRLKCTHSSVSDYFSTDLTATTEWQRFDFSQAFTSIVGGGIVAGIVNGSDTQARSIEIYGLQLETNATYPTSYIPTYGVSQTRLADVCIDAGNSSLFNSTGGVLFFEASALFDDTTRRHISVSDGSTANRLILRYDTTSNIIQAFVQVGGIIYANLRTSNYTITDNLKMAFKWELGNQKLYVNGQIVDSSTDVFAFSQNILNNLSFTRGGTSQPFYGNAKQVAYFPTALSDSECIALTTIT